LYFSYYDLKEDKPPPVHSMNTDEIKEKIDLIVKEWNDHSMDLSNDIMKYQVF